MLRLGQRKARARRHGRNVGFLVADAQFVACADNAFDAATVAFGIRNVAISGAASARWRVSSGPAAGWYLGVQSAPERRFSERCIAGIRLP
jgi:hypothetical protein